MFERVYLGEEARSEHERVHRTVRGLFDHFVEHPDEVPDGVAGADDIQRITDYVAGMTDRFCIAAFKRLALPEESRALVARFTTETVERVKDAADIVEIVSAYTDLRRKGERFTGLCPFHEERTPSFSVDPREKLYYCFGCEAGGDVFRFVQEKEGLGFPDAVEALARALRGRGRAREPGSPGGGGGGGGVRGSREVLERTASFYVELPVGLHEGGQGARVPRPAAVSGRRCCAVPGSATRPAPGIRS